MNMSEDVSSAVVGMTTQVGGKALELTGQLSKEILTSIAKLINYLWEKNKSSNLKKSDITGLKTGKVKLKELVKNARKNNDTIVSQDCLSKNDMKYIAQKAKEFGIPIAFTSKADADNVCVHVRGIDKTVLETICTDMVKQKITTRPQELVAFKVADWETKGIQVELEKNDLSANWCKNKDGEMMCLFEKNDKKAIEMARGEFVKKCNEVKNELEIMKTEDNFTVIKDKNTGKEISFDGIKSKEELARVIKQTFGYDDNKAEIATSRYGEENLSGVEKKHFFAELSDNPQREFSKIENNIKLEHENIFTKDFDCLRITPKEDGIPKLVFRDENNYFAVIDPTKMTKKEMSKIIEESLEITDKNTINALVDKAERVQDFYTHENKDNLNHIYEKGEPHEIKSEINRTEKDKFTIIATTKDENGNLSSQSKSLSFSDKKKTLAELENLLEKQGMPPYAANRISRIIYAKAEAQSPEKILEIAKIEVERQHSPEAIIAIEDKTSSLGHGKPLVTISDGVKTGTLSELNKRDVCIKNLQENFGINEQQAERVFNRAEEKLHELGLVSESENKLEEKFENKLEEKAKNKTSETDSQTAKKPLNTEKTTSKSKNTPSKTGSPAPNIPKPPSGRKGRKH
jgi:hypothetical protein